MSVHGIYLDVNLCELYLFAFSCLKYYFFSIFSLKWCKILNYKFEWNIYSFCIYIKFWIHIKYTESISVSKTFSHLFPFFFFALQISLHFYFSNKWTKMFNFITEKRKKKTRQNFITHLLDRIVTNWFFVFLTKDQNNFRPY